MTQTTPTPMTNNEHQPALSPKQRQQSLFEECPTVFRHGPHVDLVLGPNQILIRRLPRAAKIGELYVNPDMQSIRWEAIVYKVGNLAPYEGVNPLPLDIADVVLIPVHQSGGVPLACDPVIPGEEPFHLCNAHDVVARLSNREARRLLVETEAFLTSQLANQENA